MREKTIDEELSEIRINLKATAEEIKDKDKLLTILENGSGFSKGNKWLTTENILIDNIENEQIISVKKKLLEVLFPEGHQLRNIELKAGVLLELGMIILDLFI